MILTFVIIFGLAMGSFINALVWRLHKKRDFVKERSACEHCGHVLEWNDLIPLVSYISLRGKCRYCKKKISMQNPVSEILMAAAFTAVYVFRPADLSGFEQWLQLGLFLAITALLVGLLLYDVNHMELPDSLLKPLGVAVVLSLLIAATSGEDTYELLKDTAIGILVGGGIFYLLYQVSGGKWIGGGDVKLGFVMGAYAGGLGSLMALLIAFYSSALFVGPLMLAGRLNRKSKVPFGPFMVLGFFVVGLWGEAIGGWFIDLLSY